MSKSTTHLKGIQALNILQAKSTGETPGKKRKNDAIRSPPEEPQPEIISLPDDSQPIESLPSSLDQQCYYIVTIKKTNGQPFTRDRLMDIRKPIFLLANSTFEVVFLKDGLIDLYFTSHKAADSVLSRSKELIVEGSKIFATSKEVEKSYKYVVYGVDTGIPIEEFTTELIDSSGHPVQPTTATRLSLKNDGNLIPSRSVLIVFKNELQREVFLYGMALRHKSYKPKPILSLDIKRSLIKIAEYLEIRSFSTGNLFK